MLPRPMVVAFLRWCGRILFLSALLFQRAAQTEAPEIADADIAAAARLQAMDFTDAERLQMPAVIQERLKEVEELRRHTFPNSLVPALYFDPLPPGFKVPSNQQKFRWSPPRRIQRPAKDEDLAYLPVAQLAALVRARLVTSQELTRLSLERLKRYGPSLHCVVTLTEERALESARRADAEIKLGHWKGPLHGIPYGAKDLLSTKGTRTTWGAPPFTNQMIDTDATVIRKLDEAGAVLVAKLSLGELAMGDVWFGGLTRNPWHPDKGSSGSSAGSASSVAAGLVPFAIGSETLGSIVSPSTRCSVTGLRPTFGRVSRAGAMTLCWSMDKLGPIARTAEDCALVFEAIRGPDGLDRTVIEAGFPYPLKRPLKTLRVGYLQDAFERDKPTQTNNQTSFDTLRALGIELKPVKLPDYQPDMFQLILASEAAAAFDELTRNHQDRQLVQQENYSWPNTFRTARFISAVDYIQANRVRTQLIADMDRFFQDVDVLVAPPFRGRILALSNFTGHPTVVIPNSDQGTGVESSLTLVGRLFGEAEILAVAEAFQSATPWNKLRPDLSKLAGAP
ncbi:MAG TPA: amidase [Candidatus Limnocylindria bacterium]|nr:amidase [Candidatus Limnocylindria bacterium]